MKYIFLTLVSLLGIFLSGQTNDQLLDPKEFAEKFNDPNIVILDVRTPKEFVTGHIENAIDVDYRNEDFKEQIKKLDPDKTYLVYCRTGIRSASAIDSLKSLGFKNLYDLKGGITAWNQLNMPTTGGQPDKISSEEYNKIISSDAIVLIDFYAPWCGPCLKMEPMFKKLSEQYKDRLTIVKINADENKVLAKPYIERGFPLLIAYKDKSIQWERAGLLDEAELINLINELIH